MSSERRRSVTTRRSGSKDDDEFVRAGCLSKLPKRFANAAADAGLGDEHGRMYGHIPSLSSVVNCGGGASSSASSSTADDRLFVDMIERDILTDDLKVTFDDIAGLETAKRLLNEAVLLPLIMPEFFQGIRQPWKGVLLFGPPGTGKTMLAKAVAGVNGSTFFNVSAALLVNKYRGESEKVVRCLFNIAAARSPSILFFDEMDAVLSSRSSSMQGNDEASRRLKTEILKQMDGIESATRQGGNQQSVMVMAASNCPWDLDEALRRRFDKRIYIGMPCEEDRRQMFENNLGMIPVSADVRYENLANMTSGYAGADIRTVCREAAMRPMRRLLQDKTPQDIQRMRLAGELEAPAVNMADLLTALQHTRSSVSHRNIERFERWNKEFGSA